MFSTWSSACCQPSRYPRLPLLFVSHQRYGGLSRRLRECLGNIQVQGCASYAENLRSLVFGNPCLFCSFSLAQDHPGANQQKDAASATCRTYATGIAADDRSCSCWTCMLDLSVSSRMSSSGHSRHLSWFVHVRDRSSSAPRCCFQQSFSMAGPACSAKSSAACSHAATPCCTGSRKGFSLEADASYGWVAVPERQQALDEFHSLFKDDTLVVLK